MHHISAMSVPDYILAFHSSNQAAQGVLISVCNAAFYFSEMPLIGGVPASQCGSRTDAKLEDTSLFFPQKDPRLVFSCHRSHHLCLLQSGKDFTVGCMKHSVHGC